MQWNDETPWWAWGLLGLIVALIGIFYLLVTIQAYPYQDAKGYIPMPSPARSGTGKVLVPAHFAFGWSFIILALAVFYYGKLIKH